MNSLLYCILFCLIVIVYSRKPCAHRDFGKGSTVCVCNATYCDDLDPLKKTAKGVITLFETSKDGDRFKETNLKFGDKHTDKATKTQTITIDRSKKLQKIIGFGGAFTDSSGINIAALPSNLQENIISDYFADTGIEYTMGRIPIAGSDFSTHPYTYADQVENDDELKHFNLTKEDHDYKIPYLKAAIKASPHKVKLFGSPWGAPAWLKTNKKINNGGFLIGKPGGKEHKIFANYIVKFLDAYKAEKVPIWGLTVENEPKAGDVPNYSFNSLGFHPDTERDFIKMDLGPILEKAGYGLNTTDLMIFDDQRTQILNWAKVILTDKDAAKYVSGTAFHWYENTPENAINLDHTHELDPTKYILNTEACEEWRGKSQHVSLGDWQTFERYADDIITDLNHYTAGWVDWNLVLDLQGGPNWVHNYVDAPIIVNATSHEYYKQPFFYALGHFSKYLIPDSVRVQSTEKSKVDKLQTTAFVRPDNATVVIALNLGDESIELNINDSVDGEVSHVVKPRSIQTYVYYN